VTLSFGCLRRRPVAAQNGLEGALNANAKSAFSALALWGGLLDDLGSKGKFHPIRPLHGLRRVEEAELPHLVGCHNSATRSCRSAIPPPAAMCNFSRATVVINPVLPMHLVPWSLLWFP
jgi:hypothetical protein